MNTHPTTSEFTEDPAPKKRGDPPPPISAGRKSATGAVTGRKGIDKHIIYHFANTGRFHSLTEIMATVDPLGALNLSKNSFTTALGIMKRSHKIRVVEKPGAKGDHRYRFSTKTENLISYAEIETKFAPIIEDLLKQASMPISHQSSDRFRMAATTLKQALKEWSK